MANNRLQFRITLGFNGQLGNFPLDRSLTVPTDGEPVSLTVREGLFIEVAWICEVSEELAAELESGQEIHKNMPEDAQEEIKRIGQTISGAASRFVQGIKYYFDRGILKEGVQPKGPTMWSVDGEAWKPIPGGYYVDAWGVYSEFPVRDDAIECLQNILTTKDELLPFSLRHLHRAKNEADSRHKWIDATIAAELAIKEFLIRLKPEIQTLLLEAPSPPLDKMYGKILSSFIGEESPVRKELQKGAEIRNKLIHRPEEQAITSLQSHKYVEYVQYAIFHLLTHLLPNDKIIKAHFSLSKATYEMRKKQPD